MAVVAVPHKGGGRATVMEVVVLLLAAEAVATMEVNTASAPMATQRSCRRQMAGGRGSVPHPSLPSRTRGACTFQIRRGYFCLVVCLPT